MLRNVFPVNFLLNLSKIHSAPSFIANQAYADSENFSGSANFPYLVTPDTALQNQALADGSRYESILDNYDTSQIQSLVSQADATTIVFVNADSEKVISALMVTMEIATISHFGTLETT